MQQNIKSRESPVRLVEGSTIVLRAAKGVSNYKIADEPGMDVNKVGRWRNCFAAKRLPGIDKELPRGANHGGKNAAEQGTLRSKIIKTTTQDQPQDGTHWTTRGLARVSGLNYSFVNQVWREVGLTPHLLNYQK